MSTLLQYDGRPDACWRKPAQPGPQRDLQQDLAPVRAEVPLRPEKVAALRAEAVSSHRTGTGCGRTVGSIAVVCFALSALSVLHVEPALVAFCGVMATLLAIQLGRSGEDALLADAEGGVSVRLNGPAPLKAIEHEERATTYSFEVCDDVFPTGLPTFLRLAKDETVVVAYLPHSQRILALRNSKGAVQEG
jgi:hypothetical protein